MSIVFNLEQKLKIEHNVFRRFVMQGELTTVRYGENSNISNLKAIEKEFYYFPFCLVIA